MHISRVCQASIWKAEKINIEKAKLRPPLSYRGVFFRDRTDMPESQAKKTLIQIGRFCVSIVSGPWFESSEDYLENFRGYFFKNAKSENSVIEVSCIKLGLLRSMCNGRWKKKEVSCKWAQRKNSFNFFGCIFRAKNERASKKQAKIKLW